MLRVIYRMFMFLYEAIFVHHWCTQRWFREFWFPEWSVQVQHWGIALFLPPGHFAERHHDGTLWTGVFPRQSPFPPRLWPVEAIDIGGLPPSEISHPTLEYIALKADGTICLGRPGFRKVIGSCHSQIERRCVGEVLTALWQATHAFTIRYE